MLIVVGAVVALHHELDFFQRKILLNKKILVACVSDQELPISKYFKEQGAAVKQVQLGKINYLNFQQKLDLNHKLIVPNPQLNIYHDVEVEKSILLPAYYVLFSYPWIDFSSW